MALIASLKMASAGLGLHLQSYEAIFFDSPTSKQAGDQAEGRKRRLGQLYIVICRYLRVPDTFFDRIVANNLIKFLPIMISALDGAVFDKGLMENEDGDIEATSGNWVKIGGVLMPATDPRAAHIRDPRLCLSMDKVLEYLRKADAGSLASNPDGRPNRCLSIINETC